MYSSVELSCSRSIRKAKVCSEALTALLATASMWSAVSLWLQGMEIKKKDKVEGEVTQNNGLVQAPEGR